MLHGKLLGEDSRGLPGQRKGQQEDREVFNHLGLRGEWLGTGLEKWPLFAGWRRKLLTLGRALGFVSKIVGTNEFQARNGRVRLAF